MKGRDHLDYTGTNARITLNGLQEVLENVGLDLFGCG
jgi:hypothetical protein